MRIYYVYDMLNDEQYIMSGTAKQVARKLKTTSKKVRDYCKNKYLINRRYRIEGECDYGSD
jgi:hypothetical protein